MVSHNHSESSYVEGLVLHSPFLVILLPFEDTFLRPQLIYH